jgi:Ca-activated chloride channel family protein
VRPVEYRELTLDATAHDQAAEVQLTQVLANPGEIPIEAECLFPLPEDAAVGNLVLLVDGKEVSGKLFDKNEARKIYEDIVRRRRDPALLEYAGRGFYRTSVFPIPPHAERKLTLRYTQLLVKDGDLVRWLLPLGGPAGALRPSKAQLHIRIESSQTLKTIYSPTHSLDFKRDDSRRAVLTTTLDKVDQLKELLIYFAAAQHPVAASVLSWKPQADADGYFLLLASPGLAEAQSKAAKAQNKTVIFVLDRSGSMSGTKLDQARGALTFVLKQLQSGDTFNIVVYDDRVEPYKPELVGVSAETRSAALQYVDDIRPGGSTNLDEALRTAMGMVTDAARPAYVLFLTDGLPTVGERNELQIAKRVREANQHKARLLVWGVGDDVNARLLDRLGSENGGTSDYVRPSEDIEAGVARIFARMTSPVLVQPALELQGLAWNRLYPHDLPDLFAGQQLVVLGRYPRAGSATLKLQGKIAGQPMEWTYPVQLAGAGERDNDRQEFISRLWATRRIGDLLDQIDLQGQNKELTDELVALSKEFGIITPYTSFLAREDVDLDDRGQLHRLATERLERLDTVSGALGVQQRAYKQSMKGSWGPANGASSQLGMELDASAPQAASAAPELIVGGGGWGPPDNPAPEIQVKRLGTKTFYWKEGRWQDAELTPEQLKHPTEISQFSPQWFDLSHRLSGADNAWLGFDRPVIMAIEGKVYLITSPPRE